MVAVRTVRRIAGVALALLVEFLVDLSICVVQLTVSSVERRGCGSKRVGLRSALIAGTTSVWIVSQASRSKVMFRS